MSVLYGLGLWLASVGAIAVVVVVLAKQWLSGKW
jgi:hypothetical protein